ncbi:MAG: peptidase M28 [Kordia sp.]|nr:MAG: peptidase M28 [Kordia sp.]
MFKKIIALLIFSLAAYFSIKTLMPQDNFIDNPTNSEFSNTKAFKHVQNLGSDAHAIGTNAHEDAAVYIIKELEKLGLDVQTQEGNSFSDWGTFAKVKNIATRIKGTDNSKALVLMSHYDSAGHSSKGASDAASGVATVLEGIRAFITKRTAHKNDIIILFTDGEELGLNGARLFVKEHPWTKDIGLILNFESRGSGGPSFTLVETTDGNAVLMNEFIKANPKYPVANSLAYSIYKKLPNDTDLTVFRKEANIQGFNFAFIDDHYDYHAALDTPERLDNNTLSHQASYLMPLLNHFGNTDLTNLKSTENNVYFNSPLGMHSYPFTWILPLVIIAAVLFLLILIYGRRHKKLKGIEIRKGFLALFSALLVNGIIGFFGWKAILQVYPHYNEILHGFTYNGHLYIFFFVLLSLSITFYIYKKVYTTTNTKELLVAPIFIWLLLNFGISQELQGASFFIVPLFFALGLFFILLRKDNPNILATTLLSLPAIFILVPFIQQFPIALGLKIIVASSVLIVLLFGLLLPVLGFIRRKKSLGHLLLFVSGIVFLIAHLNSEFTPEQPKPNSLVYFQDNDTQKSYWITYDKILDNWNESYFKDTISDKSNITLGSKYNTKFSKVAKAETIAIPKSNLNISIDTLINQERKIQLCIMPNRKLNSIEINSKTKNSFTSFSINGTEISTKIDSKFFNTNSPKIATYHLVNNEPLELSFSIHKDSIPHIVLLETSHDLLSNKTLNIPNRGDNMIPKPFVINDAVIVKNTLRFND